MEQKILFVVIPERGHVNPLIGVAKSLEQHNVEVAFFAPVDLSQQISAAGLKAHCFVPVGQPPVPAEYNLHGDA